MANDRAWYKAWLERQHRKREAMWAELRARRESRRQLSAEAAEAVAAAEAEADAEEAREGMGVDADNAEEWEVPEPWDGEEDEEPLAEI